MILHHKPNPPDPPEPWREAIISLIGAAGGLGAVTVIGPAFPEAGLMGTGLLAFFGGVFLASLGGTAMGDGPPVKGSGRGGAIFRRPRRA